MTERDEGASGAPTLGQMLALQRQLAERDAQLARLQAEQERFVASVSHDLRAPLRHILAFGQLAQEELALQPNPALAEHLQKMGDSAQLLGRLIDGLTQYGRLAGAEFHPVRLDMRSVIGEATVLLAEVIGLRSVRWQVADDFPPVLGDPALLRQLWLQLLDNALKFTRPREVAEIVLGWQPDADGQCAFSVRDNGVGFDPRHAHRLFGVFQRLHGGAVFEGAGMGLARCRKIVERHGGRIWAEAQPEQGCTVGFTLPLAAP